jgi:5-methylcytosine-specific restriction endonuclease McrA
MGKEFALFSKSSNTKNGYQSNCKQCSKELTSIWRANNKDKNLINSRSWREANRDKSNESTRKWRKLNPDKTLERKRRRKAARLGNRVEKYTDRQVLEKYGMACHICNEAINFLAPRKAGINGWQRGFQVDHVIPLSKGGSDTLDNVRPSHGLCNMIKSDSII